MTSHFAASRGKRNYGAVRTALISYGIAAYAFFVPHAGRDYVLAGLGLQLALMAARALIKRQVRDADSAAQALFILELAADGVTVLLFALATLGGIMQAAGDV